MFPGQTCALLLPILERFEHSFYFRASLCILYIRAQLLSSSSSRHLHAHPNNFGQHPNHLLPTPVYTPVPMPMPMPMQILMRIPIIIIVIIVIIFISDGSILAGTNQMTCLLCSLHWITHYHSYIPFVPVCSQVLDTASLSCESPLSTFVLGQLALFSTTDVNGKATTTHTHTSMYVYLQAFKSRKCNNHIESILVIAEFWSHGRRSWTTCSSKPRSRLSLLLRGALECQIFKSQLIHLASQHWGASWKLDGAASTFAERIDKSQTWSQRCSTIVSGILWSDRAAVSRPSPWQEPLHCNRIWWSHIKSWGKQRPFSFPGVSARLDPIVFCSLLFDVFVDQIFAGMHIADVPVQNSDSDFFRPLLISPSWSSSDFGSCWIRRLPRQPLRSLYPHKCCAEGSYGT